MSLLSPEQIAATQKANLDTSLGLANIALEGFQKLVGLNVQAVKSMLFESQDAVRGALSVKDPQELAALQARLDSIACFEARRQAPSHSTLGWLPDFCDSSLPSGSNARSRPTTVNRL
jgi:hypothetical protein